MVGGGVFKKIMGHDDVEPDKPINKSNEPIKQQPIQNSRINNILLKSITETKKLYTIDLPYMLRDLGISYDIVNDSLCLTYNEETNQLEISIIASKVNE